MSRLSLVNPRIWFVFVVVGTVLWVGWRLLFPSATAPNIALPPTESSVVVAAQPHFTLTVPSGWTLETWNGATLHSRQSEINATGRPALTQFLQSVAAESTLFLAKQPTAPAQAATLLAFALPRNDLRLSTILSATAQTLASIPGISLSEARLVSDLRSDGQPIARIQYAMAGDETESTWIEFAALVNPLADEITVLILMAPQRQEAAIQAFEWAIAGLVFLEQ